VQNVKRVTGQSFEEVCEEMEVPCRSLMRWKQRQQVGEALVHRPGPVKVGSFDFDTLVDRIRRLSFGKERTRGTGALFAEYMEWISRRDFHAVVEQVRQDLRRQKEEMERKIEWKEPGLVWSMDDAQVQVMETGLGHLHVVHDLGSRYTLRVLSDVDLADGWRVATNLVHLFDQYGAPLFLKMDNGKNLNHQRVLRVLDEYGVIPLNSPAYYPPYNGAMEHKQEEIKRKIGYWIGTEKVTGRELKLAANLSGHELNHQRRASLKGRTACRVFDGGSSFTGKFTRRDRKEVYQEITTLAVDIAGQLEEHTQKAADTAFRYAVETWLQSHNVISVTRNGEVLPPLYQIQCH
jgi:hypothetical protein